RCCFDMSIVKYIVQEGFICHVAFIAFFFLIVTPTTQTHTLSLHDALPISLDKALAVSADCPRLERIFVVDTRALFAYRDERIATFAELEADGRARLASEPTALAELSACVGPDDPATIVYTSGTTADPKGAV